MRANGKRKAGKSVGISHQYCGNAGKVSNFQVAVFCALSNGDFASMVDARLYLPEVWCEDTGRCDEAGNRMLRRLSVIRRTETGDYGYKYSFTGANPGQYTEKGIAYMQAQRFFAEHRIKENRQILGMDRYRTRKWLAWHHQIALNFLLSTFILKEKPLCFDDIPLLSARDIKRWIIFKLHRQVSEDDMIDQMFERHCRRQADINNAGGGVNKF